MKKLFIAVCMALTATLAQAIEMSDYPTGQSMYANCTDELYGQSTCNIFLESTLSGMIMQAINTDTEPYWCISHLTLDNIKAIYIVFLRKHRNRHHELASILLDDSLLKYHCK